MSASGQATETALVVRVPEAEATVGSLRQGLDRSASWGVPAHVTVLYPFVPPARLEDDVVEQVAVAVRSVPRFSCVFAECRWFDEDVLWLAPEPAAPFLALTRAITEAFPEHPPYGGAYEDLSPHLTVGHRPHASREALQLAQDRLIHALPVQAAVDRVSLLAGSPEPGAWRVLREFPLGGAVPQG